MEVPKNIEKPRITGEKIIQKKLDKVNPFVKNIDWDNLDKQIEADKMADDLNATWWKENKSKFLNV
jgi:hypothetical protein